MLPKINRLTKKKDFGSLFKKGRGFKEDFLSVKIAPNKLKDSRFGFVISRKVAKEATKRNKLKRQLGEIVKADMGRIKNGFDCIFIVLFYPIGGFDSIKKTVDSLINKSKLIS